MIHIIVNAYNKLADDQLIDTSRNDFIKFKDSLLDIDTPSNFGKTYIAAKDVFSAAQNFDIEKPWLKFSQIDDITLVHEEDKEEIVTKNGVVAKESAINSSIKSFNRLIYATDYSEKNIPDNHEMIKRLLSESNVKKHGNATNITLEWLIIYFFANLNPKIIMKYLARSSDLVNDDDDKYYTYLNPNKTGFYLPKRVQFHISEDDIARFQKVMRNRNKKVNRDVIISNSKEIYKIFLYFSEAFIYDLLYLDPIAVDDKQKAKLAFNAAKLTSLKKSRRLFLYVFPEIVVDAKNRLTEYIKFMSYDVLFDGAIHEVAQLLALQKNANIILKNNRLFIEMYAYKEAFDIPNFFIKATIHEMLKTKEIPVKGALLNKTSQYFVITSLARAIYKFQTKSADQDTESTNEDLNNAISEMRQL